MSNETYRNSALLNPFKTYANAVQPDNLQSVQRWAKYLWEYNDTYSGALRKVVRYFINGLTVTQKASSKEADKQVVTRFTDMITKDYQALKHIRLMGEDLVSMGIVFVSAIPKIARHLRCPKCGCDRVITSMRKGADYTWSNYRFSGKCPSCGKAVVFDRIDELTSSKCKLIFKRWNPRSISIKYNSITGSSKYYYKLSPKEIRDIRNGEEVYLEDTDWAFIEAAEQGALKLNPDYFLCLKTDTIAASEDQYKGWSLPLFFSSFPRILQLQILEQFNEAVSMDYIKPTRLISPSPELLKAGSDPNRIPMSGAAFQAHMKNSLERSRSNPTTWVVSPVPVNYQMIGGEAKALAPTELQEWQTAQLLSGMAIPMEFRQTTFQVAAPTMGLRMFERVNVHIAESLDVGAQWVADMIVKIEQFQPMNVTINRTSFVEDDNAKMGTLQMSSAGLVSKDTALQTLNLDYDEERKKLKAERQQEQRDAMDEQQAASLKDMTGQAMALPPPGAMSAIQNLQAGMGGGAPGMPAQPGMPAAPGAPMGLPSNASLEQMTAEAQSIAQQIYGAPDRRSQLIGLQKTNQTLHALVKAELDKMDSQAASQGVMAARQGGM